MNTGYIKLFLRIALALGFLSAVADRFGMWPADVSYWGNMTAFLDYTHTLLPWVPQNMIPFFGWNATVLELLFGICLLIGYKVRLFALLSGFLLISFALAMVFSLGVKAPFDYSVFTAAAAAFALSQMKGKFLEIG